jgi:hypothetical protein
MGHKEMNGFLGITKREHVAMLMQALNTHCRAHGIARECPERLEIARRLVKSFEEGARTPEMLRAALALTDAPKSDRRPQQAQGHQYGPARH